MRVMVLVKASEESEAGEMPSEQILAEMGKYNEELVNAGIMLAGEGLHPSAKGKRVRFSGDQPTVIDGPFARPRSCWPATGSGRSDPWTRPLPG